MMEVDSRLKDLFKECFSSRHRSFLFICNGKKYDKDQASQQVMVIHHLLSKVTDDRPSLLWIHKKNAKTPRVNNNILKKLKQNLKDGKESISQENAFPIFLLSTRVMFCTGNDTHSVLGKTFGMCVIQDFEGLTATTLCRVVETIEGGGTIVFLLPVTKLQQLFKLQMDIHSRLKKFMFPKICHRFNRRFVFSLAWCKTTLIMDKNLKVKSVLGEQNLMNKLIATPVVSTNEEENEEELKELLKSLADADKPLPQLVGLCRTLDQAKCVLRMVDVLADRENAGSGALSCSSASCVFVSAARGRGKSASLGLATAAAIYFGVNNIFVTCPTPVNLAAYFSFVLKGFDALGYTENEHYSIIQSTNPEFKQAIVRLSIFSRHRQVIQYVRPCDWAEVSQAELVIIDEAATIPLTSLTPMLSAPNVFMASTVQGYEGTGRSLTLKLMKYLRHLASPLGVRASSKRKSDIVTSALGSTLNAYGKRTLHEETLSTSIRYGSGDPVERWMMMMLPLGVSIQEGKAAISLEYCPSADKCQLYYVNRDTLLCGHPTTESFLNRCLNILTSSHYRACADDAHIMADAPAHQLYVLLPPMEDFEERADKLPTPFVVIQACIEGGIPEKEFTSRAGETPPAGDLIPWTMAHQLADPAWAARTGLRIYRIATHPDCQSMGYGRRAIELLTEYYQGRFIPLDEDMTEEKKDKMETDDEEEEEEGEGELIVPKIPRTPLLTQLSDNTPQTLDYIGASFGVTDPLFRFWERLGFMPLNISLSANEITGEHNMVVASPLAEEGDRTRWFKESVAEFALRFLTLLGGVFRKMHPSMARRIALAAREALPQKGLEWREVKHLITGPDMLRFEAYVKGSAERHLVQDLIPPVAKLFFSNRFPVTQFYPDQMDLLLAQGLQHSTLDEASALLSIQIPSAVGLFKRTLCKLNTLLANIQQRSVTQRVLAVQAESGAPIGISLLDDLHEAEQEGKRAAIERAMPTSWVSGTKVDQEFAIRGGDKQWQEALQQSVQPGAVLSIKRDQAPRMSYGKLQQEIDKMSKSPKKSKKKNQRPNHHKHQNKKK